MAAVVMHMALVCGTSGSWACLQWRSNTNSGCSSSVEVVAILLLQPGAVDVQSINALCESTAALLLICLI
jgi:hypothetical protein